MAASADRGTGLPFLQGQWRRLSTAECAQRYPVEITFVLATYRGARARSGDDLVGCRNLPTRR